MFLATTGSTVALLVCTLLGLVNLAGMALVARRMQFSRDALWSMISESIAAIAAASILAKTVRDASMIELHRHYPEYGFDRHMGYPTPAHLAALRAHGPCPSSWAP